MPEGHRPDADASENPTTPSPPPGGSTAQKPDQGRIRRPGGPVVARSAGMQRAVLESASSSPEIEPFVTSDAKTAVGHLDLLGGYLLEDKATEGQILLNQAFMREISGYEEDILLNTKWEVSRKFNVILSSCLTRIGDGQGHYITDQNKMAHVVDNLTQTDRVQMIFHLRIISTEEGPKYTFLINCPGCGNEFRKTVYLDKLEQLAPPDPRLRLYDVEIPGGIVARCKILLGKDESDLGRAQDDGANIGSVAIKARVLTLNNEVARMSDIKKLSLRKRNFLRDAFEKHEGGIETTVPGSCPACARRFQMEVDISQKGFFFPSEMEKN